MASKRVAIYDRVGPQSMQFKVSTWGTSEAEYTSVLYPNVRLIYEPFKEYPWMVSYTEGGRLMSGNFNTYLYLKDALQEIRSGVRD